VRGVFEGGGQGFSFVLRVSPLACFKNAKVEEPKHNLAALYIITIYTKTNSRSDRQLINGLDLAGTASL